MNVQTLLTCVVCGTLAGTFAGVVVGILGMVPSNPILGIIVMTVAVAIMVLVASAMGKGNE